MRMMNVPDEKEIQAMMEEGKTESGFSCQIQEEVKRTDKAQLADTNGHENQETE